jgi:predicted TIM-barrel fold metal-dependent hydrolase
MLPIIDAHHHIWRLDDIGWLKGPAQPRIFGQYDALRRDYLVTEYLDDVRPSGVAGSVYVQVNWPPGRSLDEARWVQAVHDVHGWPHAMVAHADLASPTIGEKLEALRDLGLVRGIRQQLHWHENPTYRFAPRPDLMNDSQWRLGFARLAELGWVFELQVFASQMADAARLARDFPAVPQVLQHAGMPEDRSPAGMAAWREGMRRLAEQPSVHVKLSGLGTFIHENSPDFIAEIVGETVALFGPGRCLFGSNFPIEKLWTAYAPLVSAYRGVLAGHPEHEQRAMLHDNARALYRVDGLAADPL